MASYDPKKVSLNISGKFISGFGEDDIETEYNDEDAVKSNVGIHGEVSYTEGVDYSGSLKFTLKNSAIENNLFMESILYGQLEFALLLKDLSSGSPLTIATDIARIMTKPSRTRGLEEGTVEWKIAIPDLRPVSV